MKKIFAIIVIVVLIGGLTAEQAIAIGKASFVYDEHGKRDPFLKLVSPSGTIINYDNRDLMVSDMILEGIMAGRNGNNIAVINGMIVENGDKIGLFVITEIGLDTVVFKKGDKDYTIKLKKEE